MEYRSLNNSGLTISVVGIGCWPMGGSVKAWGPVDDNESIAAICEGLDMGVTLLDTAPAYGHGHSEEIVGRAIAGRREAVVVASKCGVIWREPAGRLERSLKRDTIRSECEASLRRLRTDYIDLYQIQWPDAATPVAESMETLLELRTEGKIRAIGVSNFSCQQMTEARRLGPVGALQTEFSLLEQDAAEVLLPYCRQYGIGVLSFGGIVRGLLTGKFDAASTFKDVRASDPHFAGEAFRRNLILVDNLRKVAREADCTLAQLALRWVIQQPAVTCALAGAKRASQVRENAVAGQITLSPDTLEAIATTLAQRDEL